MIKAQPSGKATGPDGIFYEIMKKQVELLAPLLTQLFIACWISGTIPDQWKISYLMPLYKVKGSKSDPNSYRGIALNSCVRKIFTGLIYQRLYSWVECNRLLPDSQYGFRREYSTISAATNLKTTIENGISSIGRYYVCFIDFAKAFDTVDRTKLMSKLCEFGISGNTLLSIYCCVTQNLFCILDSDVISDTLPTYTGVPQGYKLSPLLFSFFVADLSSVLKTANCTDFFYADDLALGSTVIDDIQHALNLLSRYCEKNDLCVNVPKTKVVKFRLGSFSPKDQLSYRSDQIEFTPNFLYQGIVFSTKLSVVAHLNHVKKKSGNSMFCLQKRLI